MKLAESLGDRKLNVASVRAINVAIRKANTQYRRGIVKEYNLKYRDTKEMAIPRRATYTQPVGSVSGLMNPISLFRFNPKERKDGLTVSIKKGDKKIIPFAFLVKSSKPGVSQQVFARGEYQANQFITSPKRLPITAIKTVSPFSALTNPELRKDIEAGAEDNMQHEFERQMKLLMDRII